MNFKQFITEMPISKFQLQGQWGPNAKRAYGYNRQDIGILQNQNAVDKIHKSWANSKNNFDFYFLRSKDAYRQVEVGEVTPEWVKEKLKVDIQPTEDHITVIFTNNTGDEKIPMTAWMMAHRLGHAIRRDTIFDQYFSQEIQKDFKQLLEKIYGIKSPTGYSSFGYGDGQYQRQRQIQLSSENGLKGLAQAVGTMRSARQGNLRNFNEFAYELVAQYIITGKIKFNPLPPSFVTKKQMAWGRPNDQMARATPHEDLEEWNEQLQGYADKYEHYLDSVFMGLEGKMYVM
mgnify:CR=1 FL=1